MGFAFSFVGGALCLDFVNTVGWHLSERPVEHLTRYTDLVSWGQQAGVLDDVPVLRSLDGTPEADRALGTAVTLRESLFRTFTKGPAGHDLDLINEVLSEAMGRALLSPTETGYAWGWANAGAGSPDRILWPVVRSAAELLISPREENVAICANGDCGWVFLNSGGRRRWCSMRGCGNRAKAARYYQRRKGS